LIKYHRSMLKSTYPSISLIISMAGKAHFICRGNDHHFLPHNIPNGETVQSFADRTPCEKCGAKIDWSEEFNQ